MFQPGPIFSWLLTFDMGFGPAGDPARWSFGVPPVMRPASSLSHIDGFPTIAFKHVPDWTGGETHVSFSNLAPFIEAPNGSHIEPFTLLPLVP